MPTTLERLQYGFDRDSRRTWRRRALATGEDNAYSYDGLSQVVQDARGNLNLNQTAIGATPASQESWDYDPTGNWRGYETQADGSVTLDQHRVHDKGNRLTQIEGDPSPILLDRAGRMRQVPPDATGDWDESLELKWDAWGRITQVKRLSNNEVLGSYAYDGMTRRTTREVDSVVQHSYYSNTWRPLEERKDSETDASMQYLWGARHRDDLVRSDRDSDDDGDLDETRYVLMDYYSPASLVDETGAVTERYAFSAFGIRRIMAPNWSPRSTSECAFEFAFQGQFLDAESGLINYGCRYYSPHLGRWTCKDPIGVRGGVNLYAQCANGPNNRVDYKGLDSFAVPELPQVPDYVSPYLPFRIERTFSKTLGRCRFEAILSFWVIEGKPAHPQFRWSKKEADDCCEAEIGIGGGLVEFGERLDIPQLVGEDPNWWIWNDPPGSTQDPQEIQRVGILDRIHLKFFEIITCTCGDETQTDRWEIEYSYP